MSRSRIAVLVLVALAQAGPVSLVAQQAPPVAAKPPAPPRDPAKAVVDKFIFDANDALAKGDLLGMLKNGQLALDATRALGDDVLLAKANFLVGSANVYLNNLADCAAFLRAGKAAAVRTGDPMLQLMLTGNLGTCLRESGDFESAIDEQFHALALTRQIKNPKMETTTLFNIGVIYTRIGEFDLAQTWLDRAYAVALSLGDPISEASALQMRGLLEGASNRTTEAVATLRKAIARADLGAKGNIWDLFRAELQLNLSGFEAVLALSDDAAHSHANAAISAANAALAAVKLSGQPQPIMTAMSSAVLGIATYRLGDRTASLDWLKKARQAWAVADQRGFDVSKLMNEVWIARATRATGNVAEALAIDAAVLDGLDRLRAGTNATSTSGATALLPAAEAYTDTIDLLFSLGRFADAYDVSERSRARAFLDTLDERSAGFGQTMTAAQQKQEETLTASGAQLQMQLLELATGDPKRKPIEAKLASVDLDLDALRREVRRQDPRYGTVRFPRLVKSADVAGSLDADTVLLSYIVGPEQSYVWAISKSGVVASTLPGRAALEAGVNDLRDILSVRPTPLTTARRRADLQSKSAALTKTLIAPVAKSLAGKKHVIIAPDGVLNLLPFEVLGGASYLTEQFAVSYVPSASALATMSAVAKPASATTGIFAVGDPQFGSARTGDAGATTPAAPVSGGDDAARDLSSRFTALPFTRVEVLDIARVFGASARTLLGADARADAVEKASLEKFQFIHFATHAFVNNARPGRSGIVLSVDPANRTGGVLQADDVMKMRLNADLVTLSACSTGLGKVVAGEGVMGLARSFLFAGAQSVAASLWNVNDSATATLMTRFYRELRKGVPRDQALAAARLSLIRGTDTRLRDPYYWAPFVLIGAVK